MTDDEARRIADWNKNPVRVALHEEWRNLPPRGSPEREAMEEAFYAKLALR